MVVVNGTLRAVSTTGPKALIAVLVDVELVVKIVAGILLAGNHIIVVSLTGDLVVDTFVAVVLVTDELKTSVAGDFIVDTFTAGDFVVDALVNSFFVTAVNTVDVVLVVDDRLVDELVAGATFAGGLDVVLVVNDLAVVALTVHCHLLSGPWCCPSPSPYAGDLDECCHLASRCHLDCRTTHKMSYSAHP